MSKKPLILGIESSCDETAASIITENEQGIPVVLSNIVSSQVDVHKEFGGVVPELAARSHMEKIDWIVQKAIDDSGIKMEEIDAVASTAGPGLIVCLSVGLSFAKAMASVGGFLCANESIVEYFRYNMRSQMFAKALPMTLTIGARKRLELLRTRPELKNKLWTIASALKEGLVDAGFDIGDSNSVVTPVFMKGDLAEATNLTFDLRENYNIFCSIVIYPVVPKGQIMLRIIPTSSHTIADIEYMSELNIGHSIISRAVFVGLENAVKEMNMPKFLRRIIKRCSIPVSY